MKFPDAVVERVRPQRMGGDAEARRILGGLTAEDLAQALAHYARGSMRCFVCGGPCDGPCEEGDAQFESTYQRGGFSAEASK